MPRFFTQYWVVAPNQHAEGQFLNHTAGNHFRASGIQPGDMVYIVSVVRGELFVCGRLVVGQIYGKRKAVALLGPDLWDAKEHIIARAYSRLTFELRAPMKLTQRLRFISGNRSRGLVFRSTNYLHEQTLRGIRELDEASARELDALLARSEAGSLRTDGQTTPVSKTAISEDAIADQEYVEGGVKQVILNVHERNRDAREVCLRHHGYLCVICKFDFEAVYGEAGARFIHVHHLEMVSTAVRTHSIDPVRDLRPVCPNCHAIIHRGNRNYSIEEMRNLIVKTRSGSRKTGSK